MQHLESDTTTNLGVLCQVDSPHTALAKDIEDTIAAKNMANHAVI